MTDSRFPNDVSEYGVEIQTDTVIKQTVKGRVQEYRTFYKDGNTTILPVDSTGKYYQKQNQYTQTESGIKVK